MTMTPEQQKSIIAKESAWVNESFGQLDRSAFPALARPHRLPMSTMTDGAKIGATPRCQHPPVRYARLLQTPMPTHWKESETRSDTKASVMKSDSARVSQLRPALSELVRVTSRQPATTK
jgi:hypothetical protein